MNPNSYQVPGTLQANKAYELHVEGSGGATFTNSTTLKYVPKSSSVFVQTDKAMYKPGQTGEGHYNGKMITM